MKKLLLISFAFLMYANFAEAQSAQTSRGTFFDYNGATQRSWAGYVAASSGYMNSHNNANVEGMPSSLKLLGSYALNNSKGIFDLGYGIQNESFSQGDAIDSSISTDVMEAAARYQFENRWQLGAIYNQFFNKGENFNANQADAEFAGAQVMREFSIGQNYIGRVGGRYMTSINNNQESVNTALIDFQIGWGALN